MKLIPERSSFPCKALTIRAQSVSRIIEPGASRTAKSTPSAHAIASASTALAHLSIVVSRAGGADFFYLHRLSLVAGRMSIVVHDHIYDIYMMHKHPSYSLI
jgi:hypothetical protein